MATIESGHKWKSFDFTQTFARWMSRLEYKEVYFEEPENLAIPLESEFPHFAATELRKVLTGEDVDSDTVVAVYGVASLYGFTKVSAVLKEVVRDIRGRLVVFFRASLRTVIIVFLVHEMVGITWRYPSHYIMG